MIGAACSSRIPQANLYAGLNFVHAKNYRHFIFIAEIFVSLKVHKIEIFFGFDFENCTFS